MRIKITTEDMIVSESSDKLQVMVSVQSIAAGPGNYANIAYYVYQPFLNGGDYPSLVNVWDNKDDDTFDSFQGLV